jgi:hypothetical protein
MVVALQIAAAELPVVVRAGVVDGVGDAVHARDGERPPLDLDHGAAALGQLGRCEEIDELGGGRHRVLRVLPDVSH